MEKDIQLSTKSDLEELDLLYEEVSIQKSFLKELGQQERLLSDLMVPTRLEMKSEDMMYEDMSIEGIEHEEMELYQQHHVEEQSRALVEKKKKSKSYYL